jgi:hypothetical protein
MEINEIHKIYGMYLFRTKKMGYILCSKHIHASQICPPKRNKLSEQRKWKFKCSGKTLTLNCKLHIKVSIFMKT